MKKRIIIAATFTACLALCAAVWQQTEKVEKTPTPSETTVVAAPQPTLPEPRELILPVIAGKQEVKMSEGEPEVEQESAPSMQADFAPVHPT